MRTPCSLSLTLVRANASYDESLDGGSPFRVAWVGDAAEWLQGSCRRPGTCGLEYPVGREDDRLAEPEVRKIGGNLIEVADNQRRQPLRVEMSRRHLGDLGDGDPFDTR